MRKINHCQLVYPRLFVTNRKIEGKKQKFDWDCRKIDNNTANSLQFFSDQNYKVIYRKQK